MMMKNTLFLKKLAKSNWNKETLIKLGYPLVLMEMILNPFGF